jgi:putative flippase GtrA
MHFFPLDVLSNQGRRPSGGRAMHNGQREVFTAKRREYSRRTIGLAAAFIITAVAGVFVDLDGLMHYFNIIGRVSPMTLETGAIISLASAIPFLAMGMSISKDADQSRR